MSRCLPAHAAALITFLTLAIIGAGAPFAGDDGGPEPATAAAPDAGAAGGLRLARLGSFSMPVHVTAPPGDSRRVFVVEQAGRIRVLRDGRKLASPFLDIRARVSFSGERGLLSMAFAPDYATTGRFYVYYTDNGGDIRVDEFRRSSSSADRASASTRRGVLRQEHSTYPNHNGGQLQFGPERYLYIGLGDGGGGGDPFRAGQRINTWLGKILRINPRRSGSRAYTVPATNPFARRAGAKREIYSYGLRNPWRFGFDRETGGLAIADVGQNAVEEINYMARGRASGANFGWNVFEGNSRYAGGSAIGHDPPVLTKGHGDGWCSIIGGYVVRDAALGSLEGRYLYGDFCRSELRSVRLFPGGSSDDRSLGLSVSSLTSFGEDARGRIYVTSAGGGLFRLVAG